MSRRIGQPVDAVLADRLQRGTGRRRVVDGQRGGGWIAIAKVVRDHVTYSSRAIRARSAVTAWSAVHLGQRRGLLGRSRSAAAAFPVVAHQDAGGRGRERDQSDGDPRSAAPRAAATRRGAQRRADGQPSPLPTGCGGPRPGTRTGRPRTPGPCTSGPSPDCPGCTGRRRARRCRRTARTTAGSRRSSSRPAMAASGTSSHEPLNSRPGFDARRGPQGPGRAVRPRGDRTSSRCGGRGGGGCMTPSTRPRCAGRAVPAGRNTRVPATSKDAVGFVSCDATITRRSAGTLEAENEEPTVIVTLIVICEVAFTGAAGGGLALRYWAKMPRAGVAVLLCEAPPGGAALRRHRHRPQERRRTRLEARPGRRLHRLLHRARPLHDQVGRRPRRPPLG